MNHDQKKSKLETQTELFRKAIKEKLGDSKNLNQLPFPVCKDYRRRLATPYEKKGESFCFEDQYNDGDGNELIEKFWNPISSSRFCFEMYSWLGKAEFCDAIELEHKLPSIKDGLGRCNSRIKAPNMDAMFTIGPDIYLIESKFTEIQKLNLSKLSPSYYENNKGENSLLNRYHGSEKLSVEIPKFIKNIMNEIQTQKLSRTYDSFDPKQEITHLIGIALWLNENPDLVEEIGPNNKRLHFYNVFYGSEQAGEGQEFTKQESFKRFFIKAAKEAFWDLFEIELDYQIKYSQEFIAELLEKSLDKQNTKAFASENTVLDQLSQFAKTRRASGDGSNM